MLGLDLSKKIAGASPEISLIIPVHNEERNIPALLARLEKALDGVDHELVFTDDGSVDGSLALLRSLVAGNPRLRIVSFSRNFGHQVAVTAGLEYARGEAMVIIDADLQDPPEVIPEMIAKWKDGADIVYGQRMSRKGESVMKKLTAKIFYRLMRLLTQFSIPIDTGDFRLVSRRAAAAFLSMPERHRFVRGMFSWVGFRQAAVFYQRDERLHGKTSYTYTKMFRLAFDAITSFSYVPLKLSSYVGFFSAAIGLVLILFAIYEKMYGTNTMRGWTSLAVIVLFLGGIQLMMIGFLGEYLGRVHDEMKHRPLYVVRDTVNVESPKGFS